jgi:4-hydroxy-3-methylbut-2-enyl diphosphate reductase
MVDNAGQIDPAWLAGKRRIGLTAGASAPEVLVRGVIDRLRELGVDSVEQMRGIEETTQFPLPSRLVS